MTPNPRGARLRECLERRDALLLPGCANALALRVVQDLGYEAAYVSGAGITNTFLGLPDLSFISLDLLASHVAAMRDVSDLPLVVDADTGFGNALNVGHTVRVLERAGADCIQIEDQVFPKRCGHFEGKEVVPIAEFAARIRAASEARAGDDLLIMARTDAIACTGFDDAIERMRAARDAGADVFFVEAPRDRREIEAVPSLVEGPCLLNLVHGGKTPSLPRDDLASMGYAAVLYANAALQASIAAMQSVLGSLLSCGSLEGVEDRLAGFEERQRLVGKPAFDALESRYTV
jgi:2-methylisocitrate lyase-like PEP mutase family enzyme